MTSPRPEKLDHVALYVSDPDAVAARLLAQLPFREIERTNEFVLIGRARLWLGYGFERADGHTNGAIRLRLGDSYVELRRGSPVQTDRPLLNQLGLLVESVDEVRQAAEDRRLRVNKFVDADNSRALFLGGPDDIELEYIEHKPSFALA